ncbi:MULTISPECIES: helix-turn-helix domain-containing protein [Bacillus]|uniref:helix-turn-helix domain-containing protein n=1 Tax=Bacillus TaxID=1386 RepID=UPI000BB95FA6|nr:MULTISPECIES: helix-turn-helix transcriptional regulator [Bacillus]
MRKTTILGETIGESIREIRKAQKRTIEELADAAGINDKFLGEIERGEKEASVMTIMKIARGLDLKDPLELLINAVKKVFPTIKKGNQGEE